MKKVAIVQARLGSTRLPGKILMDLAGRPMLAQQIRRMKRCRFLDEIVVATTTASADDAVVELARHEGVGWFRGSQEDVLSRYLGAARESYADLVVRITGDCPLVDPEVTDLVVSELAAHSTGCDYASNSLRRTYPRGLDAEALFWDVLLRINRMAATPEDREHVTVLPRQHPGLFLTRSIEDSEDNSDLRWTVDHDADLQLVRTLYERLGLAESGTTYREIVRFVREHQDLAKMNAGIRTWDPVTDPLPSSRPASG